MEIKIPPIFCGVSEEDGRHDQMDFGDLLLKKAAKEEHNSLVQSGKVIILYPPVCPLCGLESPDHNPNFRCGKLKK